MAFDLKCLCVSNPEVDLSENRLGEFGAKAIASMLQENSTLLRLNLSGNCLNDRSAEHLGPALTTNTRLQHLDLSYNTLGEQAGNAAAGYGSIPFKESYEEMNPNVYFYSVY